MILGAILMAFMWNLNEVWWNFWMNRNWIWFEFDETCGHFIFWVLKLDTSIFRVFFAHADYSFSGFEKKLVKLQNAINKIRVAVSFFSNLFLCLSQLSQATLWPELPNFVQKLCSFKRVISDLIHEWKSYGGVKTDID